MKPGQSGGGAHYIKLNENTELPECLVFVDVESWINTQPDHTKLHTLRLGCAKPLLRVHTDSRNDRKAGSDRRDVNYREGEFFDFKTKEDFWAYLDTFTRKKIYVMAHNCAYDFGVLDMYTYLSSRGFIIDFWAIRGAYIIRAEKGFGKDHRSIILLDTMNYFNCSLEKLGKAMGQLKLETRWGHDFEGEIYRTAPDDEVMTYCHGDVMVMLKAIHYFIRMVRDEDLGCFKLTAASQAWASFRHRFCPTKVGEKNEKETTVIFTHDWKEIRALERESYRGGRSEAWFIGEVKERVYKLDINSMYPSVMMGNQYPVKNFSEAPVSATLEDLREASQAGRLYIAKVLVELKVPMVGVKMDGKLMFPIGTFEAVLTSPEIEGLLDRPDRGRILEVREAIFYEGMDIFSDYVDYFYSKRKMTDDEALKQFYKIFLNSLYGKLAQREFDTIEVDEESHARLVDGAMKRFGTDHYQAIEAGECVDYIRIGGKIYRTEKQEKGVGNIAPAISSFVTAYARMKLWSMIEQCPAGSVLYMDTDSLFVTLAGKEALEAAGMIDQKELGKLKLEDEGEVSIQGVKLYAWKSAITGKENVTMKGIRKEAEDLGNNEFLQEKWETRMDRFNHPGPPGTVRIVPVKKKLSGRYEKGVVTPSGWVKPYALTYPSEARIHSQGSPETGLPGPED